MLFAEAREEARALDEEFASTGSIRGPLHGVPVSFKDQCESGYVLYYSRRLLTRLQTTSRASTPPWASRLERATLRPRILW